MELPTAETLHWRAAWPAQVRRICSDLAARVQNIQIWQTLETHTLRI